MKNDLLSMLSRGAPTKRIASRKGSFAIGLSPNGKDISIYEIAMATDLGVIIRDKRNEEYLATHKGELLLSRQILISYEEAIIVSRGHIYVGEKVKDRTYFFQPADQTAV
jgi:hypothetical protein